jgi:hypothetical protein
MTNQEIQDLAEAFAKAMSRNTGSTGASAPKASAASGASSAASSDFNKQVEDMNSQMKDVRENLSKMNKVGILPSTQNLETARKRQGQFDQDMAAVQRRLEELDTALDKTREGYDKINPETKQSLEMEKKKLKELKNNLDFEQGKKEVFSGTVNAIQVMGQTMFEVAKIEQQGMANILSAAQGGGAGFSLMAASANMAAEKTAAFATAGAKATQSLGDAMAKMPGIMGGIGTAISMLSQAAQQNIELEKAAKIQQNNLLAAEGEKLATSFRDSAQAGALFADGADGMIRATKDSRITMQDLAAVVKENREALGRSGAGVTGAIEQIGRVGSAFKKSGMDQTLLGLGYSYKEQAGLMADVMADMNKGRGASAASDAQVEANTKAYAANLSIISAITGEDAKKKMAESKEAANNLAFQNKLANMSAQDQQNIQAQMANMSAQQKKDFMEQMVFGRIINKTGAVMAAQIPSYAEGIKKSADVANAHYASAEEAQKAQEKVQADMNAGMNEYVKSGKGKAMGMAGMAGNQFATEIGNAALGVRDNTQKYLAAQKERDNLEGRMAAGGGKDGSVDKALKDASAIMNDFQMKIQEFVTSQDGLTKMVDAQRGALKAALDAYRGTIPGGLKELSWLEEIFSKFGKEIQMASMALMVLIPLFGTMKSGLGIVKDGLMNMFSKGGAGGAMKNVAGSAMESAMDKGKGAVTSGIADAGKKGLAGALPDASSAASSGKGGAGGILGDLADGLKKLGPALSSIGKGIGGAIEGVLRGIAGGLMAFANPAVVLGAAGLGAAIVAIGAGIAGAAWIMGKALPTLAEGIKSFADIPGKNLIDVGLGIAALGAGLAVFGAGSALGGTGSLIGSISDGLGSLFGGKDLISKLKDFATLGPGLTDAGKGLTDTSVGLGKFTTSLGAFLKTDFSQVDKITEKLNRLKEASKPPEVSVTEAAKGVIAAGANRLASFIGGDKSAPAAANATAKPATATPAATTGKATATPASQSAPTQVAGAGSAEWWKKYDAARSDGMSVKDARAAADAAVKSSAKSPQQVAPSSAKPGSSTNTSTYSETLKKPDATASADGKNFTVNGKPATKAEYDAYQKQQQQAAAAKPATTDPSKLSNDQVALTKQMVNLLERISKFSGDTSSGIQKMARAAT